jgi:hypothetical protein
MAMISDVLFEAIAEMDRYLGDDVFKGAYAGELREEIVAVRTIMESLRRRLDGPAVVDEVKKFFDAHCTVDESAEASFGEIYKRYDAFCREAGLLPVSRKRFARRLADLAPGLVRQIRCGCYFWKGIKV